REGFARVNTSFPALSSVSVCVSTIFSYAAPVFTNEFQLRGQVDVQERILLALIIHGKHLPYKASFPNDGGWHHICVTWHRNSGQWAIYVDGVLKDMGSGTDTSRDIHGDGILILGQDQDSFGGNFTEPFFGAITDLNVWNMSLETRHVNALNACYPLTQEELFTWNLDHLSSHPVVKVVQALLFCPGKITFCIYNNNNNNTFYSWAPFGALKDTSHAQMIKDKSRCTTSTSFLTFLNSYTEHESCLPADATNHSQGNIQELSQHFISVADSVISEDNALKWQSIKQVVHGIPLELCMIRCVPSGILISRKHQQHFEKALTVSDTLSCHSYLTCLVKKCPNAAKLLDKKILSFLASLRVYRYVSMCCLCSTSPEAGGWWNTKGCEVVSKEYGYTVCHCNHTTNFALLLQVYEAQRSPENESALQVLTFIGCGVSLCGLLFTFILFIAVGVPKSDRTTVHKNLIVSMGIAELLLMCSDWASTNEAACFMVTALLHLFFMASFSWMLVEGLLLWSKVVSVNISEDRRMKLYYVIGWGLPVLIVGVTLAVSVDKYKADDHCWLNVKTDTIWAFVGPVVFVLTVNAVVLCRVVMVTVSSARRRAKMLSPSSASKLQAFDLTWAVTRPVLILLPVLGLTWLCGLLVHLSVVVAYVFISLNAFQVKKQRHATPAKLSNLSYSNPMYFTVHVQFIQFKLK
uniref:Adhesion G protein-coupled receptor D2 n=1 Tax=Scophthalmus maximus TaxID=52904 RepID=A0A8D2ZEA5_SCOMX